MTAPTQQNQLTAAQLATLLALVKAQAAVRQRLTNTAVAAATTAFHGVANWWSADDVNQAITLTRRILQPTQQQAARITASYMAQVSGVIAGRNFRPAATIDVTKLRKDMSAQDANDFLDGIRVPAWVVLGDSHEGPAHTIDDPALISAAAQPAWLDAADPYGRAADGYRYNVTMRGDSDDVAAQKAMVRIANVAETDVTLAVRQQYQQSMSAHGALGWRRILHPELSETGPCALCVVAADRLYRREDLLPIHGHCVPAGTRVAANNVLAVTRRDYAGPLVVLLTASGQELTITPNHPVLTDQGWIPAGLVDERHHLLGYRAGHGVAGHGPAEGDGPTLVEEVWRAASMVPSLPRRTVPVAAQDFHGDGADGEVDVVRTHSLLSRVGDVSFGDPAGEHLLMPGHGFGSGFAASGGQLEVFLGGRRAPHGVVRGGGDRGALLSSGAGVVDVHSLGLAADLHSGFLQTQIDDPAFDAVLLGQRQHGGTGAVLLDDLSVGQDLPRPTRFDPAGFEYAGDGRHAYAQLGRDLRDRLAGDVEPDRVVNKRWIEGTDHVYNLHTAEGWYSANGLVVSNCVCEVLPVYQGADPGITLNGDDLRALYSAAGGNTRQALRRVTVALSEHAELGPILVDAAQVNRGPVDVATTKTDRAHTRYLAQLEALEQLHNTTAYRISRGDDLGRSYKAQASRIQELKHLTGVS